MMHDALTQACVSEARYEHAMQRVRELELEILNLGEYIGRLENAVKSRGKLIMALEELVLSTFALSPVVAAQYPQRERDCDGYYEEANLGYWGC